MEDHPIFLDSLAERANPENTTFDPPPEWSFKPGAFVRETPIRREPPGLRPE